MNRSIILIWVIYSVTKELKCSVFVMIFVLALGFMKVFTNKKKKSENFPAESFFGETSGKTQLELRCSSQQKHQRLNESETWTLPELVFF